MSVQLAHDLVAPRRTGGLVAAMFNLSPDLRILAEAQRPALGFAGEGEMPARLVGFASQRHRVAPLLSHAVATGGTRADGATTRALADEAQRGAVRALRQKAAALAFSQVMHRAGITHAEVKGSRLGELLYGGDSLRHSKDVDMLIAAEQIDPAIDLIIAAGYRNSRGGPLRKRKAMTMLRYHREVEVRDPKSGVTIELHSRVLQYPPRGWRDDALLGPALDLSNPHYVLYLILHGASAHWHRLKMQADLAMIANLVDDNVRTQIIRLAGQYACLPALAASFGLCDALWAADIADPWRSEIGLSDTDKRVASHARAYEREINRMGDMPLPELVLRRLELQRDAPIFGARHMSRLPVIRDRAALWLLRKF